ncbi:Gbp1, partial [Symbiodinium pilosum]
IQNGQRTEAEKLVGAICLPLAAKDLEAALDIAKAEALEKLDASLVMLTPKLAERTKQGVYCHILELVEEKRKANAFALHRRRTRLATFSLAPLLCLFAALGIILAGQPSDCDDALAVAGFAGLVVNPLCWRHIPEVNERKAAQQRRKAEEAEENKLKAEQERQEEARLEALRLEAERAEQEAHENRQLALTGLGSIGLAWAVFRRDLAWFR